MKHLATLVIKFILVAIVLEVLLNLMTNLNFGQILWLSLLVTVLSYAIGDLIALPLSNNTVATIVDVLITFVVLYMYNLWAAYTKIGIFDAAISAVLLGTGEWFFHKYVHNSIFAEEKRKSRS